MHLIGSHTAGAQQIAAAHPPVIRILDLHNSMLEAMRVYKAGTSKRRVVLQRCFSGTGLGNPNCAD